jgi:hypothetical protein
VATSPPTIEVETAGQGPKVSIVAKVTVDEMEKDSSGASVVPVVNSLSRVRARKSRIPGDASRR